MLDPAASPGATAPTSTAVNPAGEATRETAIDISPTAAADFSLNAAVELPLGFRDQFFERRFRNTGQVEEDRLVKDHSIAFLTKAVHADRLYQVNDPPPGYPPGQYRIRNSGSERPFLTLKAQGDGTNRASDVVDIVEPADAVLEHIHRHGQLLAIIEKFRKTYHSKNHPQCLLHIDEVTGLGAFYDVKADRPEHLQAFLHEIGLGTSTPIAKSYLQMLQEQGISKLFLKVWPIHETVKDYVQGVLSGALTSGGFLIFTTTAGGSKGLMLASLLTAGLVDGTSDSVAAGQATQSESGSTGWDRFSKFGKTFAGKFAIPCTYIPIVLSCHEALSTSVSAGIWAATLVTATTAVQSIARAKPLAKEIATVLGYSIASIGAGTLIGKFGVPLLERLFNS